MVSEPRLNVTASFSPSDDFSLVILPLNWFIMKPTTQWGSGLTGLTLWFRKVL